MGRRANERTNAFGQECPALGIELASDWEPVAHSGGPSECHLRELHSGRFGR
jgi:hypothetical protein